MNPAARYRSLYADARCQRHAIATTSHVNKSDERLSQGHQNTYVFDTVSICVQDGTLTTVIRRWFPQMYSARSIILTSTMDMNDDQVEDDQADAIPKVIKLVTILITGRPFQSIFFGRGSRAT